MKTWIGIMALSSILGLAAVEETRRATEGAAAACRWRDDTHAVFRAAEYEPATGILMLEFRNGYAYRYRGVPAERFREFRRTEAKGAFYNERIRGHYPMDRALDRSLTRPTAPGTTRPRAILARSARGE